MLFLELISRRKLRVPPWPPGSTEHLPGALPELVVEEAVDEGVDGVIDEEGLHAELVGQLSQRAQGRLQVRQ